MRKGACGEVVPHLAALFPDAELSHLLTRSGVAGLLGMAESVCAWVCPTPATACERGGRREKKRVRHHLSRL